MAMPVRVLAFAGARDVIGAAELEHRLDEPSCTAGELMDALCARFPKLSAHRGCIRLAINGTYADDDQPVVQGDEVALIPPVAGG